MPSLAEALAHVRHQIAVAAQGRSDIQLIAVSKTQPLEALLAASQAGQHLFGENRVQEAQQKKPFLPPQDQFHLIGPLQINKARHCPGLFTCIHSLHRVDLALELERRCAAAGVVMEVLIQLNLTQEDSKSGLGDLDELKSLADLTLTLPHLRLTGLMTMGDPALDPDQNRRHFARLREILLQEQSRQGRPEFRELSMGMSGDFLAAIAEGATMVRVGTAIFGHR